ncbi:MAG: CcmD family protein [Ignavibacteria bacterium]|nr:CcmD family protein [Ignavibacteria bacterium]
MLEFLSQNQMFVVLVIVLLIWGGIIWYLLRLEKKLKHLEDHLNKE